MMDDNLAITLRSVSKKYPIYDSTFARLAEALHPTRKQFHRDFWALRDVDLDVRRGETLGILGVNGCGKSTLLQVICSILQPSSGTVDVRGRVAALIELGAGFNPELDGRRNAEMNCVVAGMSLPEARSVLPEIERFADIGEFFDQPVKTYSSGMFMRVAFATAVHIDPEILVIDEALAVGDARFQEKCFRKFRDFQKRGRTILLVTHDRFAVPRLCTSAIMLDKGKVVARGEPRDVTEAYGKFLQMGTGALERKPAGASRIPAPAVNAAVAAVAEPAPARFASRGTADVCSVNPTYNPDELRYGQGGAAIIDFKLIGEAGENRQEVPMDSRLQVLVRVRYDKDVEDPLVGVTIRNPEGVAVYTTHSGWLEAKLPPAQAGTVADYRFSLSLHLAAGNWFFNLAVAENHEILMDAREAVFLLVVTSRRRTAGLVSTECEVEFVGSAPAQPAAAEPVAS